MAEKPSSLSRLLNWNKKSAPKTVDAEQYAKAFGQFKKLLLEQYQIRLQAKTAKRLPINLFAKSTNFGMYPDRVRAFLPKQTIESQDIATEIDKILRTHDRLLILGDPGAGKTTILLFAAVNILLFTDEQKLPLILNLATWNKKREFKEWYVQNIAHTYSLSPVFVEELLHRNAVVPFFDGFDEVAEDSREDCFQKMAGHFGDQRSRQIIVSSRKKEYAVAKADAPLYAEIEVLPLTLAQIKKALFENGQAHAGDLALMYALDRDEYLGRAVETPFYLNTASFLFGKGERTLTDFSFKADSVGGRQEALVEIFVEKQVPEKRDKKYLLFLARKMKEENFLVFELVKMRPDWREGEGVLAYGIIFGVISGLIMTLALSFSIFIPKLFNGYFDKVFLGDDDYFAEDWLLTLVSDLKLGLTVGWIFGSISGILSYAISTKDIQVLSWKAFTKIWGRVLLISLIVGFGVGTVFDSFAGLFTGLAFGLIVYLGYTDSTAFFGGHPAGPYHRFRISFLSFIWVLPMSAMNVDLGEVEFSWEDMKGFVTDFLYCSVLFVPIPLLISQFPQHFALRFLLYLENKLPLRLVTFLDRMTDQHIFEDNRRTLKGKKQRGATWRFRHKILQDYFANMPDRSPHGSNL